MTASLPGPLSVDREILALGREVESLMKRQVPGVFDRRHWEGRILDWAMASPEFKTNLFRFVDVLPSLRSSGQVANHAREYLLFGGVELPGVPASLLRLASKPASSGLLAWGVRKNIERLAGRFVVGKDSGEALARLQALHRGGLAFTVDLLGETTLSDAEAAVYQARYLELIENLPEAVAGWASDHRLDRNHLGPIPRANVSLKISAMDALLDPVDPTGCVARLAKRVLPLVTRARERGVCVHFDLERWDTHDIIFDLFEEVACHPDVRGWPHVGATVQAYLKRSAQDLERVLSIARSRGAPVVVRLVKGAYWDSETVSARQQGHACPVYGDKAETDASYEALTAALLRNAEWLQPAFASHNLRSLTHAVVTARELRLPKEAVEIQTLYGMAEPERDAFRSLGYRVRVYAPVGELVPGMAYLVRRLLENTSNEGFLRLVHREGVDLESLLARPKPSKAEVPAPALVAGDLRSPFSNCSHADFTDRAVRGSFAEAVAAAQQKIPIRVPVVVRGKPRFSEPVLEHPCPSDTVRIASTVALATREEADAAVRIAAEAWPAWREKALEERAALLERLADRLEAGRYALAALEVVEVAKPWWEADADVTEAVDFCRFYARQALIELSDRPAGNVPGERNRVRYEGRGPAVVIAPWNFPLAILTGMATAALAAGNTVVLKPAEQSSAVAHALHEAMMASGFPPETVQFLPGLGEEIGAQLVSDPRVAVVAFTGSRALGLSILETSGRTQRGQSQIKKVVCEMGGKNAIVVDEDADLDAAVAGVVQSAFGYAGQKCSACSRVITVGDVHEPFLRRLLEACRTLPIGPASDPAFRLGPVVDRDAFDRLRDEIAHPGEGANLLFLGRAPEGGFYVPPAVYELASSEHRFFREELFGPILAVCRARDFAQAIALAVSSEYALTGGVYSRTPSHLELATRQFRVGNLYLNRGITGAMVGRQPFGGFRMSGTGTQAGGPAYLLHFAEPRCVTENTVRRGFAPEVQI